MLIQSPGSIPRPSPTHSLNSSTSIMDHTWRSAARYLAWLDLVLAWCWPMLQCWLNILRSAVCGLCVGDHSWNHHTSCHRGSRSSCGDGCHLGPFSIWRYLLIGIGNPIVKIRRSYNPPISPMGFLIPIRRPLNIESAPCHPSRLHPSSHQRGLRGS